MPLQTRSQYFPMPSQPNPVGNLLTGIQAGTQLAQAPQEYRANQLKNILLEGKLAREPMETLLQQQQLEQNRMSLDQAPELWKMKQETFERQKQEWTEQDQDRAEGIFYDKIQNVNTDNVKDFQKDFLDMVPEIGSKFYEAFGEKGVSAILEIAELRNDIAEGKDLNKLMKMIKALKERKGAGKGQMTETQKAQYEVDMANVGARKAEIANRKEALRIAEQEAKAGREISGQTLQYLVDSVRQYYALKADETVTLSPEEETLYKNIERILNRYFDEQDRKIKGSQPARFSRGGPPSTSPSAQAPTRYIYEGGRLKRVQ